MVPGFIQFLACLVLGGIFVYASSTKSSIPQAFARVLANYRLLPAFIIHGVAAIFPWVECVAGVSLILGAFRRSAALLLTLLLVMFMLVTGSNVLRGLNVACGCFSASGGRPESPVFVIVRDLLFLVPAVIVLFFDRKPGKKLVGRVGRESEQETLHHLLDDDVRFLPLDSGGIKDKTDVPEVDDAGEMLGEEIHQLVSE